MSCGRQACAANRESTAGASLLAQIIVGKFASYLLIDGATLSIRRVEYVSVRRGRLDLLHVCDGEVGSRS